MPIVIISATAWFNIYTYTLIYITGFECLLPIFVCTTHSNNSQFVLKTFQ